MEGAAQAPSSFDEAQDEGLEGSGCGPQQAQDEGSSMGSGEGSGGRLRRRANSASPCQSCSISASFLALDLPLICRSRAKTLGPALPSSPHFPANCYRHLPLTPANRSYLHEYRNPLRLPPCPTATIGVNYGYHRACGMPVPATVPSTRGSPHNTKRPGTPEPSRHLGRKGPTPRRPSAPGGCASSWPAWFRGRPRRPCPASRPGILHRPA